jgi:hypothetical protein
MIHTTSISRLCHFKDFFNASFPYEFTRAQFNALVIKQRYCSRRAIFSRADSMGGIVVAGSAFMALEIASKELAGVSRRDSELTEEK